MYLIRRRACALLFAVGTACGIGCESGTSVNGDGGSAGGGQEISFAGSWGLGDTLLDDEADERCFEALGVTTAEQQYGEVLRLPFRLTGAVEALDVGVESSCGAFQERGRSPKTPELTIRQGLIAVATLGKLAAGGTGDAVVATTKTATPGAGGAFAAGDFVLELAIDKALEALGPRDDVALGGVTIRISAGAGTIEALDVPAAPTPRSMIVSGPLLVGDGEADDEAEGRCFGALGVDPAQHAVGEATQVRFELTGEATLLRVHVHRSCGVSSHDGRTAQTPALRLLRDAETISALGHVASAGNNEEVVQTSRFFSTVDEDKELPAGVYALEIAAREAPALKPEAGALEDAALADVEIRVVSGDATIVAAE